MQKENNSVNPHNRIIPQVIWNAKFASPTLIFYQLVYRKKERFWLSWPWNKGSPDLESENIGHPGQSEFQINNRSFCSISMSQILHHLWLICSSNWTGILLLSRNLTPVLSLLLTWRNRTQTLVAVAKENSKFYGYIL